MPFAGRCQVLPLRPGFLRLKGMKPPPKRGNPRGEFRDFIHSKLRAKAADLYQCKPKLCPSQMLLIAGIYLKRVFLLAWFIFLGI